jgi:hypothetical protein
MDSDSISFKSLQSGSRRYVGKDTAIKETESGRGEVIFIVLLSASLILVVGWIMG